MFKKLFVTGVNDKVATLLRVTLGLIMFPHGAQKVFGWFGGYGFNGTMNSFTNQMGIPAFFAFMAILAEFAGSLGLIFGFLTRIAALGIAINMMIAVFTVHLSHGFFMNWFGNQKGEGIEYHLLAIVLAIGIMIRGGGAYSLDQKISEKI